MAAPVVSGDVARILLLPVDLDESALDAVRFAVDHIIKPGDTILLLHVVPAYTDELMPTMGFGGEPVMVQVRDIELEHAKREDAVRYMTKTLASLLHRAGCTVRVTVPAYTTDPHSVGKVVADVAKDVHAAMIVVPSKSKGKPYVCTF